MKRFLAGIYAFKFLDTFLLIFPLYAVMFVDAGLTPVQISVILTAWSATAFVVEIPAGVAADIWPRRSLLVVAQLIRGACFAVWWIYPHFWGFLAGLVLWGVKSGLTSGTFEALVYDELKAAGRAGDYVRLFGRARALQALGMVLASLAAALTAGLGFGFALAASVAAAILAAAAAAAFPAAPKAGGAGRRRFVAQLTAGLREARANPAIGRILLFAAAVMALGAGLEEFWPVFGVKVGVGRGLIALFVAGQQGLEAGASLVAHRLERLTRRGLGLLAGLAGAALTAAALIFQAPALALLAAYSGLMRLLDVALEGRLQHRIASESRATIGSVKGFAARIGVAVVYMALGPLAQAASYRTGFLACGLAALGLGLAVIWRPAPRPTADRRRTA